MKLPTVLSVIYFNGHAAEPKTRQHVLTTRNDITAAINHIATGHDPATELEVVLSGYATDVADWMANNDDTKFFFLFDDKSCFYLGNQTKASRVEIMIEDFIDSGTAFGDLPHV